jgi:protein-disulfide isomerase
VQPYGSPWPPPPPPPPSRAPWAILVAVLVIVIFGFGAMVVGGFLFFKMSRSAAVAPVAPATTWSPPPPATTPLGVPSAVPRVPVRSASAVNFVPVGSSPVRGKRDALVTLVEFSEFQCPYCSRVQPTLEALRASYGDDLRVVWKNEPLAFHPHALPAAEVALEARRERGDAGFWAVHDDLFAQPVGGLDGASLLRIARKHGVDASKAASAIASSTYQSTIDDDDKLAKRLGVSGTPTFFVNGRILVGAQPYSTFVTAIDDELAKAKARVAKGTPRARVYDEIMAGAKAAE